MRSQASDRKTNTRKDRQKGAALVELAVVMTVISLLAIGIMDFGRIGYTSMALTGAARAGAMYGAQSVALSKDTTGMRTTAQAAASDIGTITTAVSRTCECEVGGSNSVIACTGSCAGVLRIRVSVTANKTFALIRAFPQLPTSVALSRTAIMRAQ